MQLYTHSYTNKLYLMLLSCEGTRNDRLAFKVCRERSLFIKHLLISQTTQP